MTHREWIAALLLALVLSSLPATAGAQAPTPPPPPPVREGSAQFAFVGTTGNSSTQTIGIGGELVYRPSPWETRLKATYVRNEAENELRAQALVVSLRAQRPIAPRLSGYGQYAYQRDRFAGTANRNTVEGGLAYTWVDTAPNKLIVDAGLGYANEHRLSGNNLSTATLSGGSVYTLKLSPTSGLSEDGHFIFSLSDVNDWRYANIAALTASLTSVFSLKLSNTVRYVNRPPSSFKQTDVVTEVALVAKF